MVLESQPPHKNVNLSFQLVIVSRRSIFFWGGGLLLNYLINAFCEIRTFRKQEPKEETKKVKKVKKESQKRLLTVSIINSKQTVFLVGGTFFQAILSMHYVR